MQFEIGLHVVYGDRGSGKTTFVKRLLHLWEPHYLQAHVFMNVEGQHFETCTPRSYCGASNAILPFLFNVRVI
jgi:ABC-type multidrug transport system ATPase subunit